MVVFFVFVMIGVVVGKIWARNVRDVFWTKDKVMILCVMAGILLGVGASFLGGNFVKKEVVVEKYFISPMVFDGKPVAALIEHGSFYVFQIKEASETEIRLVVQNLSKEEIFFTLNEGEERYLEIKRGRTSWSMWVWFFYGNTRIIESKVVLKKGDKFLKIPCHQ